MVLIELSYNYNKAVYLRSKEIIDKLHVCFSPSEKNLKN